MSYSDIGALSVRLNLDTNNFNKKISTINKEIRFLERDFKSAGKGVKNFENSFKGVNQKIQTLTKQLNLSNRKLIEQKEHFKGYSQALKRQQEDLKSLEEQFGRNSKQYKKQEELIAQTTTKMRSLGSAIEQTKGQIREYGASLQEAKAKMTAMGNTTKTFAEKLKIAQQESKLASTNFSAMLNSLDEGTMEHATVKIKQLEGVLKSTRVEANLYSNEIKKLQASQKSLSSTEAQLVGRIKEVESALSGAKATYGQNSSQVDKLSTKLAELKTRLAETRNQYENNNSAIREHRTELNKLEGQIAQVNRQLHEVPADAIKNKFDNVGRTMMNTGATLSASVGLPLTLIGKSIVTTAMNFEEGMSKVQAITVASEDEMAQLTEQARELGATTQFSATEASEAMSYLAMAGLKTNDIMSAMPATLDIAKAGMLDLGETADITTNIMSGFGLGAKDLTHVGDVLAYASSNANTNIRQMGEAMVYLAPVGNTLGLTLEDVSSAVMTVSNSGIQGARAGAAFSTSLVRLTKPTKEMKKLMDKLGITFETSEGKLKPISQIAEELNGKMSKLTDAQRASAINTLFGAEATKHWSALLNEQEGVLEKNTRALEKSDGSAKAMAKTMAENLAGSMKEMKSKLEDMAITIGNALAPTIERVAKMIGEVADWFRSLSPATQELVAVLGILGIVLPVVTTGLGMFVLGLGALNTGMQKIIGVGGKTATKIDNVGKKSSVVAKSMSRLAPLMRSPWTALIGAVVLGGKAIWEFKKSSDKHFKDLSASAKDNITGVGDYLNELPSKLKKADKQISETEFFSTSTKATLIKSIDEIEKTLASGKGSVSREAGMMVQAISSSMGDIPKEMRQSVAEGVAEFISALYADGKIAEKEFKTWIDQLNGHADVQIKVNYDELKNKNEMSMIYNDYVGAMERVGSTMNEGWGDIQHTVNSVSDALVQAKDKDIETFNLLSMGLADHVAGIKMSEGEQKRLLMQMAQNLSASFSPEQTATQMANFASAMQLGYQDIGVIQSQFIQDYNNRNGSMKTDTARAYADFIAQTGNFELMLAGKFGSLSAGNAQFWFDFINRIGTSSVDVKNKSQELVTGMINELKLADSPEAMVGVAKVMADFVNKLVETGKLSASEANTMIANINKELGGITPEVSTVINAEIGQFSKSEKEILAKLGVIDKATAESDVLANTLPAKKALDELDSKNKKLNSVMEERKPAIKIENKDALEKISEVEDKKINDKKASIILEYSGVPSPPSLPPLFQSIKLERVPMSLLPEDTQPQTEPMVLARDSVLQPFNNIAQKMNAVAYSGSMYQSQPPQKPPVTRVENTNDSTMIRLFETVIGELTKLHDKQQTLEAQLYIDGRQLKSHFETMDKRQVRLSGR